MPIMTTAIEQQGGAQSSHEALAKEEKDDNSLLKTLVESSSPSISLTNDEPQKSGEGSKKDNGDRSLTPSNYERNNNNMDSNTIDQVPIVIGKETTQVVKHTSSITKSKVEELELTKVEMGEVMEENQRLKQYLSQIMKDYQILQKKFNEISEQDLKQFKDNNQMEITPLQKTRDNNDNVEEEELVSLSLGRSSSCNLKKGSIDLLLNSTCSLDKIASNDDKRASIDNKSNHVNDDEAKERSLDLGLECKSFGISVEHPQTSIQNTSLDNSFDETKDGEDGGKEPWSLTKVIKSNSGDDEVVQQPPTKKARVSVRVRCDTPTMNDGCQWRKYGQKIAKGNPCPRAYYRCTVAPSCPVRKQVQRCADDMSILITTYEGTHNHPLPVSATAMASTTSAAAYMLMSKSSSSTLGSHPSTTITSTPIGTELHGDLKFNILDDSKSKSIFLPNSSTFSPITAHPTITLDLTSTTSPSINQHNRVTSNFGSRYHSPNLNFNFSNNSTNPLLLSWPSELPNFGTESYINKNHINLLNVASSRQQTHNTNNNTFDFQDDALQKSIPHNSSDHESLPDTIAQAAKVLTSDPSFQSILTATLSSFISGNNNNVSSGHVGNNVINSIGFGDNMK